MESPSRTKPEAVVVVNPLSSGAFLARKLAALTNVITVNSSPLTEDFMKVSYFLAHFRNVVDSSSDQPFNRKGAHSPRR